MGKGIAFAHPNRLEVATDRMQLRLIEHIVDEGIAQGNLGIVVMTG